MLLPHTLLDANANAAHDGFAQRKLTLTPCGLHKRPYQLNRFANGSFCPCCFSTAATPRGAMGLRPPPTPGLAAAAPPPAARDAAGCCDAPPLGSAALP